MKFDSFYLERTGCFGECPVYHLEIYSDGLVVWVGDCYVDKVGFHSWQISKESIKELEDLIDSHDYLNMTQSVNNDMKTTCMETCITAVTHLGNEIRRIKHYYGDYRWPESLYEFEAEVDRIAGAEGMI